MPRRGFGGPQPTFSSSRTLFYSCQSQVFGLRAFSNGFRCGMVGQTAYINQAAVMKEVRGLLDYGSLRYVLQQEPREK